MNNQLRRLQLSLRPTSPHPTAPRPTALHPTAPSPTAPRPTAPHPTAPHPTAPPPTTPRPTAPRPTAPRRFRLPHPTGTPFPLRKNRSLPRINEHHLAAAQYEYRFESGLLSRVSVLATRNDGTEYLVRFDQINQYYPLLPAWVAKERVRPLPPQEPGAGAGFGLYDLVDIREPYGYMPGVIMGMLNDMVYIYTGQQFFLAPLSNLRHSHSHRWNPNSEWFWYHTILVYNMITVRVVPYLAADDLNAPFTTCMIGSLVWPLLNSSDGI